jgi:hypothetical protein
MKVDADEAGAYRDGIQALLDAHEARLRRVEGRARALTPESRRALLPEVARDLEATEAHLRTLPKNRDELDAAQAVLDAYERQVELALSLIAELHDAKEAEARRLRRSRRGTVLATGGLAVAVAIFVGFGLHADQQAAVRREERRREAHFAGCPDRPECKERGLCSPPPRARWGTTLDCIADADEDCVHSRECKQQGRCSAVDGVCRVVTASDCQRSKNCIEHGECTPVDGVCRVVSDADCRWQELCYRYGRCSADQGVCRALKPADCARSYHCKDQGECVPQDGRCAVSDEGCRATEDCKLIGACAAVGGGCAPARREDCVQSEICKDQGRCALSEGPPPVCVPSTAGCRASQDCRLGGECTATPGGCVVGSAADCRSSEACRKVGACTPQKKGYLVVCAAAGGPVEGR